MTRPRVYVETTIPSFYHEERTAPDIVARREWTRQWWSDAAERYELANSPAVLDELAGGPPERSHEWLDLIRGVPQLPSVPHITALSQTHLMSQRLHPHP